ncbi:LuxR C-terminal-related transcriptional regulator [Devosia sp. 1566]|uniref:LuxR family transcriptional regulator n=1 Tax=Devosia sp. 1566 TaxID=2499144 RepID=UPI000FDC3861|nr:LuxR C-terminal-related transcriptional regulator [Devosia sp. 1566]
MLDELWNAERLGFRTIADDAPTAMWLTLPTGYCFYLNRSWVEFTGQTENQGHGSGWAQALHPDDRVMAYNAYFRACVTASPYQVSCRLQQANGGYQQVTAAALPHLDQSGNLDIYVGAISLAVDQRFSKPGSAALLSPREKELLRLSALGKTAGEVAALMGIAERTAHSYMGNIMRKLSANNRVHAVVEAIRLGEIEI